MRHRPLVSGIALFALLASAPRAHAQPHEARGLLVASHSQLCLSPRGTPAVAPCGADAFMTLVPVGGARSSFLVRRDSDGVCLFSNRDGRFGWYACTPAFTDQHWTWLPSSEAREQ